MGKKCLCSSISTPSGADFRKQLDRTTWKDQRVRDWLSSEAVCLKVDAEKDVSVAEKYRINVYPTVLLLRPDGTEIDRLVGYRDAKSRSWPTPVTHWPEMTA